MSRIEIVIADDHAIVRDGLKQLFAAQADTEVLAEATDGVEAIEAVKEYKPDVILLDIAMPRLNGLEVIRLIPETAPGTRVVVLSMHDNESYVRQVLEAGVLGYILKASPSSDILNAVRAAYKGEFFLSPKIKADVIHSYLKTKTEEPAHRGYDLLSEREQQVFRLVVEGNSTREISGFLGVSPKTIEKHRSSISTKLGICDRMELLKYAIKIGIVNPDLW